MLPRRHVATAATCGKHFLLSANILLFFFQSAFLFFFPPFLLHPFAAHFLWALQLTACCQAKENQDDWDTRGGVLQEQGHGRWVAVGYRNESGTNFATLWGMQPGTRNSAVVICRLMPFWQNNFSYYCSSAALLGLKIAYKFSVAYFAAAAVESATRSSAPCQVLWPGQATGTQLGANCQKGILEVTECDRKISGKTSICNNTTALGQKWPAIIIAKIVELDNVLCFSIWTKF